MDNRYLRQGPLDHIRISAELEADQGGNEATVVLEDRGFRGQIVLRGRASDAEFFDAVSDITGLRSSKETNAVITYWEKSPECFFEYSRDVS